MSKAHLCYPNSIHSIRVSYILNDGNFIEDTLYINIKTYICDECNNTCVVMEIISHPYYRESDFIPRQPYRDSNAPIAAGIFRTASAFILGPVTIPVIGLSGWTAATWLSATVVLTGVLGSGVAISSYIATLNSSDGKYA